jgi:hypothetical protein
MLYESKKPLNTFGSQAKHTSLGAPEGVAMSTQLAELLRDLTSQVGLRDAGVLTPWGARKSDLDWQEVKPDTNIATFEITDRDIQTARDTVLFGQQLPFLGVLSGHLQSSSELQSILDGSPYEWYETLAVYRQDDKNSVPNILFFHWLKARPEDQIGRTSKSMDAVASEMFGRLLFAQQVPLEGSTIRSAPAVSFSQAFNTQEPDPLAPEPVTIEPLPSLQPTITTTNPTPVEPAKTQPKELVLPILVGFFVAASTVYVLRKAGSR